MAEKNPDTPAPETSIDPASREARQPAPPEGNIRVIDRRWWARGKSDSAAESGERSSDKPTYVQELERRLAAKDEELRATITRYREASNEFEQTRLRIRRDVAKDLERSKRAMLADLLDVVDNLERAIDAARADGPEGALLQGVVMVRTQFLSKLESLGIRRLDSQGTRFDPAVHEAATVVPTADPAQDGTVVGVIRPGYAIGDELLRPAVVAVARLDPQGV